MPDNTGKPTIEEINDAVGREILRRTIRLPTNKTTRQLEGMAASRKKDSSEFTDAVAVIMDAEKKLLVHHMAAIIHGMKAPGLYDDYERGEIENIPLGECIALEKDGLAEAYRNNRLTNHAVTPEIRFKKIEALAREWTPKLYPQFAQGAPDVLAR